MDLGAFGDFCGDSGRDGLRVEGIGGRPGCLLGGAAIATVVDGIENRWPFGRPTSDTTLVELDGVLSLG